MMPGMASVRARTRKDGSTFYAVLYRHSGKQTSTSFDDEKEARRFRDLVGSIGPDRALEVAEIAPTQRAMSTLTVAEWLESHIASLSGVEKKTIIEYQRYAKNDIGPALGAIPLSKLARADVAAWVNTMREAGAARGTIENKHGFLSGALKRAVEDGHLAGNPCVGVKLPRTQKREMVFLTPDEFAILKGAFSEHYQPLVEFLVVSGCRASEALALKPSDVNRETGEVRINKAWHRGGQDGYYLGPPKTDKSVRTINVPKATLDQLDYSQEWLFTGTNGKPVRLYSWRSNVWYKTLAKAQKNGLKKSPRIHDLRHTCASWLIQRGIHPRVVQEHLGHESVDTTMGTYGHLDRSSHVAAADALATMLM